MGRLSDLPNDTELTPHPGSQQGPRCWYELLADRLEDEDAAELDDELSSGRPAPVVSRRIQAAFADELAAIGRSVRSSSVRWHRRGECRCGTPC